MTGRNTFHVSSAMKECNQPRPCCWGLFQCDTDMTTLLNTLANALVARENCHAKGNTEWFDKWTAAIHSIEDDLPSGSGIDRGTKVDLDLSDGRKMIVLDLSYHHMNEGGMYDGWTEHRCTITPDLLHGFTIKFSGPNRNDIKEYLHDVYQTALSADYEKSCTCPNVTCAIHGS